ncbi:MAG: DUF4013 domain-containing protein [Cyanobacteriota bacterium]
MAINLSRSFKAPFYTDSEEGILRIYLITMGFSIFIFAIHLIFGVLGLASTLFICFIHIIHLIVVFSTQSFQFGYLLETARLEVEKQTFVMPGWNNNYGRFFYNGLKIQLIFLIYLAINTSIGFIVYLACGLYIPEVMQQLTLAHEGSISYTGPVIIICLLLIAFLIPVLILIFNLIIAPMICIRFAITQSFLSAFNLWTICKSITLKLFDYVVATIIVIVLLIPVVVVTILLCLTLVGWIGIGLLQFIFIIIALNMYAQIYSG